MAAKTVKVLPEGLVRVEGAAEFLDVSRTKVYALIKSGELRSLKVGGSRRVSIGALREYAATATSDVA